jgi:hypothetical protein
MTVSGKLGEEVVGDYALSGASDLVFTVHSLSSLNDVFKTVHVANGYQLLYR